tara:strand:+ start:136 stop:588 length:453 start_codon:yes stop_codon:yes gene_type:complete
MADLTIYINEKITLDGNDRGVLTTQTISNINSVDNRILSIPTGSYTPLFYFNPSDIDAGTFSTGSFKYGRITNKSSTVPIQVRVTADTVPSSLTNTSFVIAPGNSFFLSTTAITGSSPGSNVFIFNQYINYVSVAPSGSSASIEYFIATT